ncbi:MAG: site-2 protease family protein [Armatimonadota bacterium]
MDWVEQAVSFVLWLMAVLVSLTVHEFAHAKYARWAGDPTPEVQGRVTLNPLAHLDPMGTLMILIAAFSGYGFGWGKPVEINPGFFRHPRRDWVMCAFWGPLSNILLALMFAGLVRLMVAAQWGLGTVFFEFAWIMVLANLGLALFNLLPIHPLDGSKVLSGFLRDVFDRRYWSWQITYGPILFLVLVLFVPVLTQGAVYPIWIVLGPIYNFAAQLLLG